jgi:hypothetical protein
MCKRIAKGRCDQSHGAGVDVDVVFDQSLGPGLVVGESLRIKHAPPVLDNTQGRLIKQQKYISVDNLLPSLDLQVILVESVGVQHAGPDCLCGVGKLVEKGVPLLVLLWDGLCEVGDHVASQAARGHVIVVFVSALHAFVHDSYEARELWSGQAQSQVRAMGLHILQVDENIVNKALNRQTDCYM